MNVVDSSAWLEYFADSDNAKFFAPAIEDVARLIVPSICILEVYKRVLTLRGHSEAIECLALMHQGRIAELDVSLAVLAAQLSVQLKLPLADSVVLATARQNEAVLWTQDSDFEGVEGVRFFKKQSR